MFPSGIAQWEVQKHVYSEMLSDAVLQNSLTGGIHDMIAPPEADYPYMVIGDWTESNDDMQANVGRQCTATIHVWSNYEGSKEAKLIGNQICVVIDRKPFVTENWNCNVVYLEYVNNMLGSDDRKQHLIMRFRFKLTRR